MTPVTSIIIASIFAIGSWEFGKWIFRRIGWKLIHRTEEGESDETIDWETLSSYSDLKIVWRKLGERAVLEIKAKNNRKEVN